MKRFLVALAAFFLLAASCSAPVFAANQVRELSVDVTLRADGSACVTQEFLAFTEEGTEFYLERMDSGRLSFTDFSVSDESGPYTVLGPDEWNVDASFDEKAGKCGMRSVDGGVELCWGITAYGERRYTVSYVIHNLVGAYSDADGFNYRWIDPDQEIFPTDVSLAIRRQDGVPLTEEDCEFWAFGFNGEIWLEDGAIRAKTTAALEGSDNMTVMARFRKGMFSPVYEEDESFESVKRAAFEGSDYDDGSGDGVLWGFGLLAVMAAGAGIIRLIVFFESVKQKKNLQKLTETSAYFRDAPNGGNLSAAYVLANGAGICPDSAYLGARILRLIALGSLEPEPFVEEKKTASMRIMGEPRSDVLFDKEIYDFLKEAAGADGVLQVRELEQFCEDSKHAEALDSILDRCIQDGRLYLLRKDCLKGAVCESIEDLTPQGIEQLRELLGLKRYLLDFSLLAQRGVNATVLWQDYMVYAMLLGIAKQVIAQMKELYPDQLKRIGEYEWHMDSAYQYHTLLCSGMEMSRQRQQQAARSAGKGGRASLGGGFGSFGGGGMGTR